MNEKYISSIQRIAEQFCEDYLPVALKNLENGIRQWENVLDENDQLNQLIHSTLETDWGDLVDNRNGYWDKESVTEDDKRFMFRRVKKDSLLYVKEKLNNMLLELLQENMRDYFEHEKNLKSYCLSAFEKNEQQVMYIEDLLKMKSLLESLLAQANAIAKLRIYLDARNLLTDSFNSVKEEIKPQSTEQNQDPSTNKAGDEKSMEDKPAVHLFERKLRGGYVPFVKSAVPEFVVRKHGFQHGDFLYVERMYAQHQKFRYRFSLAQKVNKPQHERQQINYCLIQQDNSMTYTEQFFAETMQTNSEQPKLKDIRYDGIPFRFVIKEEDIREFKLKTGDVVDLAFWHDNPSSLKVIWKHYKDVHALERDCLKW